MATTKTRGGLRIPRPWAPVGFARSLRREENGAPPPLALADEGLKPRRRKRKHARTCAAHVDGPSWACAPPGGWARSSLRRRVLCSPSFPRASAGPGGLGRAAVKPPGRAQKSPRHYERTPRPMCVCHARVSEPQTAGSSWRGAWGQRQDMDGRPAIQGHSCARATAHRAPPLVFSPPGAQISPPNQRTSRDAAAAGVARLRVLQQLVIAALSNHQTRP